MFAAKIKCFYWLFVNTEDSEMDISKFLQRILSSEK